MSLYSIGYAERWLDELYVDLVGAPELRHGEDVLERMESQIRAYTPELQQLVFDALGRWLAGNSAQKVHYALAMIRRFHLTQYIATLEALHANVEAGRSPLPAVWAPTVRAILDFLKY